VNPSRNGQAGCEVLHKEKTRLTAGRREYEADAEVRHIRVEFSAENWWNGKARSAAANSSGRFNNNSD
jgi:hypothetical protein